MSHKYVYLFSEGNASMRELLGGKGANQAAAAAHSGATVVFVGALGSDPSGQRLRCDLASHGVDVTHLREAWYQREAMNIIEQGGAVNAETLSGIPSIIYGLVGMLVFCEVLGMGTSLLAGALTLAIMNLPTILRTTQESLKTVPQSYREGAFGLGAGKWRVVRTVVLPGCIDGVITGCILSVGRILGESAALLFTAGFAHALHGIFDGLSSPGATLTVALYVYAKEEGEFDVAFAIAAILMVLALVIHLAAELVSRHFQKKKAQ